MHIHRPRQHSQGFFEPSLGSAGSGGGDGNGSAVGSTNNIATAMSGTAASRTRTPTPTSATSPKNITASQAAAQAAMHLQQQQQQQQQQQHHSLSQSARQRSQTVPFHEQQSGGQGSNGVTGSGQTLSPTFNTAGFGGSGSASIGGVGGSYNNGILGGHRVTAASAATAAYPKSALGLGSNSSVAGSTIAERGASPTFDGMDLKPAKEKSKKKLFSKPKTISISRDKDSDRKYPPHPSPNKLSTIYGATNSARALNSSTLSLVDSVTSGASSIYTMASNASTSTLVPAERISTNEKEKDKEKKHHFLSRQKHKLRDKDDHHHLPLSSANSTSKPTDPNDPQPLYSFAVPVSPGPASTFTKSVSGLDLRHGGRALRERKREERAGSSALATLTSSSSFLGDPTRERELSVSQDSKGDWSSIGTITQQQSQQYNQQQQGGLGSISGPSISQVQVPEQLSAATLASLGQTFGLPGLQPDDAWPLLKARLLLVFEGEDPRPPIEDFNGLVSVHIRRCIQRRAPDLLIEDFCDLLHTGFVSLDHALQPLPDERLVPHLVEVWLVVYGTIFPFLQAVFLPLDLEFKGRGPLMSAREAADFWEGVRAEYAATSVSINDNTAGDDTETDDILDVRRLALIAFRDCVILPRYDTLMAIFSRLSLENVLGGGIGSMTIDRSPDWLNQSQSQSQATLHQNTGQSTVEPALASYSSQTSTLLDSTASLGARSRATSNTSAGSFHSVHSQPQNQLQQSGQLPPIPALPTPAGSSSLSLSSPLSLRHQQQNTPGTGSGTSNPLPPNTTTAPTTTSSSFTAIPIDSTHITNTVGRMLQCVSVLASVHHNHHNYTAITSTGNKSLNNIITNTPSSNLNDSIGSSSGNNGTTEPQAQAQVQQQQHHDDRQAKMERLAKELKHNWLGRGRTGRQRRGFIGGRGRMGSSDADAGAGAGTGGGILGGTTEGSGLASRAGGMNSTTTTTNGTNSLSSSNTGLGIGTTTGMAAAGTTGVKVGGGGCAADIGTFQGTTGSTTAISGFNNMFGSGSGSASIGGWV